MEEGISAEISEAVETIKTAGKLYLANWYPFLIIGLGFGILNELTNTIMGVFKTNSVGIASVINIFLSSFLTMAALNLSLQIVRQEKVHLGRAFKDIRGKYFLYITVSLLSAVAAITGFLLLILPGIYFVTVFYFADLYVMMGKHTTMDALKSSMHFVKGVFRPVFLCLVLIVCLILIPMAISQNIQPQHYLASKMLILIVSIFLVPFTSLSKVVLHERVKKIKDKLMIEE